MALAVVAPERLRGLTNRVASENPVERRVDARLGERGIGVVALAFVVGDRPALAT